MMMVMIFIVKRSRFETQEKEWDAAVERNGAKREEGGGSHLIIKGLLLLMKEISQRLLMCALLIMMLVDYCDGIVEKEWGNESYME